MTALILRSEWPFTEWETCRTQKTRENGKENGPGPKWPKNGRRNGEKNGQNPILGSIFPFRRPFFGHFGLGAIFICVGQVSLSVHGHSDRNHNQFARKDLSVTS